MSDMDEISRKLLGWYGAKSLPGSKKPSAGDTVSKSLPLVSTSSPKATTGTKSSSVSRSGVTNSLPARATLKLRNKSANRT